MVEEVIESEAQELDEQIEITEEIPEDLEPEEWGACIEALFFANSEPLSIERISEVTAIPVDSVMEQIVKIRNKYAEPGFGFELLEVGGAYQFRTRSLFAPYISLLRAKKPRRLSPPALETLAVIAYRQPVVRSDIEKIRGVDAGPTLKTLLDRKLIKIIGHQESVGQPALYGTTDDFLKLFGLSSLNELPSLRDMKELEAEPGEAEEMQGE